MIVAELLWIEAQLAYFASFKIVHGNLELVSPVFDMLHVRLFVFERVDLVSILFLPALGLFVLNFVQLAVIFAYDVSQRFCDEVG